MIQSRARLVSSDNGLTYTLIGLSRAEVLSMRALLAEGVGALGDAVDNEATHRPVSAHGNVQQLVREAYLHGHAAHGVNLCDVIDNRQVLVP